MNKLKDLLYIISTDLLFVLGYFLGRLHCKRDRKKKPGKNKKRVREKEKKRVGYKNINNSQTF